jgi:stearoyl-CoA desaturase (delta-9 desaturase)
VQAPGTNQLYLHHRTRLDTNQPRLHPSAQMSARAHRRRLPRQPLVPPELGRVRFDAGKTLWLWAMALPGLAIGLPAATPTTLVVSLTLAFLTLCVGHSVGLHRGIIHRTYEAHPIVRGALAYLGG